MLHRRTAWAPASALTAAPARRFSACSRGELSCHPPPRPRPPGSRTSSELWGAHPESEGPSGVLGTEPGKAKAPPGQRMPDRQLLAGRAVGRLRSHPVPVSAQHSPRQSPPGTQASEATCHAGLPAEAAGGPGLSSLLRGGGPARAATGAEGRVRKAASRHGPSRHPHPTGSRLPASRARELTTSVPAGAPRSAGREGPRQGRVR